ncbi:MAG: N-6 DNA methylase [Sarcina sp.]
MIKRTVWEIIQKMRGRLEERELNKLIIVLLGSKFWLNSDKNKTGMIWNDVFENKVMFITTLKLLGQNENLSLFSDEKFEQFLNRLSEDEFKKLMTLINSSDVKSEDQLIEAIYTVVQSERNSSEYMTNLDIYKVLFQVLNLEENSNIIDSFNGISGTLTAIYNDFKESKKDFSTLKFYAQEINEDIAKIGSFIGYILAGDNFQYKMGDSISDPQFVKDGKLMQSDFAISNIPWGVKRGLEYKDIYGRFTNFKDDKVRINATMWLEAEHVIATAKKKAAILMPMGALFRESVNDRRSREELTQNDEIECIIKFPSGVISGTGIEFCWIIINKNKDEKRKNKVQFIDLSNEIVAERLSVKKFISNGIEKVKVAFENMQNTEISFIVENDDIKNNNFNLDMFEYVKKQQLISEMGSELNKTISDIAKEVKRGVQITKSRLENTKVENGEKQHYLVSLANLVDGKVVLGEEDKIVAEDKWVEKYELREGDVLLTSKGSTIKTAIVDKSIENAILSANLVLIRVDKAKYDAEFLKYYLDTNIGRKLLGTIMKGAIIMSISNKDLESFMVPDIDITKQKSIMSMVNIAKEEYKKAINDANDKFDSVNLAVEKLIFKK